MKQIRVSLRRLLRAGMAWTDVHGCGVCRWVILVGMVVALGGAGCATKPARATSGAVPGRPFYNIAHMANAPHVVDWAVAHGANGIEVDLNFTPGGELLDFRHGSPCECTALAVGGICSVADCDTGSSVPEMVRHVGAQQRGVKLVIIDTKVEFMPTNLLAQTGRRVAEGFICELYRQGYDGQVVMGVPRLPQVPALMAALHWLRERAPEVLTRVRFTVDGEGNRADEVLSALAGLQPQVAYGTGVSAMLPGRYFEGVETARRRGVGLVYVWTIDRSGAMKAYIERGVDGIVTNRPERLSEVLDRINRINGELY